MGLLPVGTPRRLVCAPRRVPRTLLLAQIAVPTLLMHGARRARRRWLNDGVRHVADHVSDPHLRKVADTGHFGVAFAPEPIADELIRFLTAAPRQS